MNLSRLLYQSFFWRSFYYLSLLLLNISIARYFEASVSGWFNYILSIAGFLVLAAGLSLDSAIGFYSTGKKMDQGFINRFILSWCFFIATIGLIIVLAAGNQPGIKENDRLFYFAILLFVVGNIMISFLQAVLYSSYNFRLPGLLSVIFNLLFILLLWGLHIAQYKVEITEFLLCYSAAFFVQGVLLFLLSKRIPATFLFKPVDKTACKMLFRFAIVAFAGNTIFFLLYRIDYWFVYTYCTDQMLGNYIQVSKIAQLFLLIPSSVAAVIFPATAQGQPGIGDKLKLLSRLLVSFFAAILLVLVITGQWLFVWIFGASFDKMYMAFIFLLPGILALTVISLLGAYFAGRNLVKINLKGAVIAFFVMLISDALLVPGYGINGAAIACSISYTVYLVYLIIHFSKVAVTGAGDMFLVRREDLAKVKVLLTGVANRKAN